MFYPNSRDQSVQGGFIGNAGAPETAVAGTWIRDPFPQGQQPELDQLWRRGMDNTPAGQRIRDLRDLMKTNPGAVFGPQAMGMPGMNVGNMGGISVKMQEAFSPWAVMQASARETGMGPYTGTQQEQETQRDPSVKMQEAFSPWAVMQASARKAGFDKKTVS